MNENAELVRYNTLVHSHGEPFAAYDRAFQHTYKQTKDLELATLKALEAFVAANKKSEARLLNVSELKRLPEPKATRKVRS